MRPELERLQAENARLREDRPELAAEIDSSGPEEPVRLLRFWPDQYLKLQQYFKLKPKKEYLQKRRDLASYRSSHAR